MKAISRALLLLSLLVASGNALTRELPYFWNEQDRSHYGIVDTVSFRQGMMVVGDTYFQLSPNLVVLSGDSRTSMLNIQRGSRIRFITQGGVQGGDRFGLVTQVWLLHSRLPNPPED